VSKLKNEKAAKEQIDKEVTKAELAQANKPAPNLEI